MGKVEAKIYTQGATMQHNWGLLGGTLRRSVFNGVAAAFPARHVYQSTA
jgi:hypothetical protein